MIGLMDKYKLPRKIFKIDFNSVIYVLNNLGLLILGMCFIILMIIELVKNSEFKKELLFITGSFTGILISINLSINNFEWAKVYVNVFVVLTWIVVCIGLFMINKKKKKRVKEKELKEKELKEKELKEKELKEKELKEKELKEKELKEKESEKQPIDGEFKNEDIENNSYEDTDYISKGLILVALIMSVAMFSNKIGENMEPLRGEYAITKIDNKDYILLVKQGDNNIVKQINLKDQKVRPEYRIIKDADNYVWVSAVLNELEFETYHIED
jgi:hypothetical protein